MPLSQIRSYMALNINHKLMPTYQTWSYTKTHIGSYVMTYVS
ncbi:hypothetical protein F383_27761 [Gossypium arboreum]|uniref:Uncharacterized protein n=1 Tax=Gossypium arboreum TaxID=29729 RepID=A0A0B0PAJ7_GOSAR|nr:hypothetical protein F383_27761 [Gossypium arboreum]